MDHSSHAGILVGIIYPFPISILSSNASSIYIWSYHSTIKIFTNFGYSDSKTTKLSYRIFGHNNSLAIDALTDFQYI